MAKPDGATSLGRNIYLFKSKTNSTDCIISAHGGFMAENSSFKVPDGLTLYFYGPHGAALLDPGTTTFYGRMHEAESVEVIRGGQDCRNYLLSKYQGAHAGSTGTETVETYAQLSQKVSQTDTTRGLLFNQMMKAASIDSPNTQRVKQNMTELKNRLRGASILTIRNRWDIVFGVPLSDALKALRKEAPSIREVHCLFCRCAMLPDKVRDLFGQTHAPDKGVSYRL
ncbi:putative adhesin [Falsiroseomonas oryziterrae]|uniref:putative adhesin n=1 Tax=Falsiroseomonas oryziterrae TaxID=2911368 RepID=UPI001F2C854E|nr:hypothetical protein [Roseomonas sp. NPKOSM-4]